MKKKTKDFNRNPNGSNQWETRSKETIQEIINSHPSNWTKKDFRGEGVNNKKKILTRKETERSGLVFGHSGKTKQSLKEVYKFSTYESINEFEKRLIDEDTFRNRARTKKQRDLTPNSIKQAQYRERHAKLTESELSQKRLRDKTYKESLKKIK